MKKFTKLSLLVSLLFSFTFLLTGFIYAIPLASLTNIKPFPSTVSIGSTGTAKYEIKNNVDGTLPIQFVYPSVLTKTADSCDDSLAQGEECQIELSFQPSEYPQLVDGKFVVKFRDGSGVFSNIHTKSSPKPPLDISIESGDPLILLPSVTKKITVKNLSDTYTAKDVTIHFPSNIANQVSITPCSSIAPDATCDIEVTTHDDATKVDQKSAIVQGNNTNSINITAKISDQLLSYSNNLIHFDQPYETTATKSKKRLKAALGVQFTNESSTKPIRLSEIRDLSSEIHNIGLPSTTSIASDCPILAPGASCTLPFTAPKTAYGQGTATIDYTLGTTQRTQSINLLVDPTSITLSPEAPLHVHKDSSSFSITLTNNPDKFTWYDAQITPTLPNGITLSSDTCSGHHFAPGNSCQLHLNVNNPSGGDTGNINVDGTNLYPVDNDLVIVDGNVSVYPVTTPDVLHFGYREVKVENNYVPESAKPTITIENFELSSTDPNFSDKVSICHKGDTSCVYQSTCEVGEELDPSVTTSCVIWLKAKKDDNLDPGALSSGTLTVTTDDIHHPHQIHDLNVNYEQDLYAVGGFTATGDNSVTLDRTAKWNGKNWSALATGLNSHARTSIYFDGDFYLAGDFTTISGIQASRIARWNGSNWSKIAGGINGSTLDLEGLNHNLYIAGAMTYLNFTENLISGYRTGKWDGTEWSALGSASGLNNTAITLTTLNNNLYVGGDFTATADNAIPLSHIARWDPSTSTWSDLNSGTNGTTIRALTVLDNNLYAGGNFTSAGDPVVATKNVAKWNGSSWSALGSGLNNTVFALTTLKNNIYAGGYFFKHFAKWDPSTSTSTWSIVGSGINGTVLTLTGFGNKVYAGGIFTLAGEDNSVENIAVWNTLTSTWSTLGAGLNSHVSSITIAPSLVVSIP